MMKYFYSLLLILSSLISLSGQIVNADGKGVIFSEERIVDIRMHTNGWSLSYGKGDIIKYNTIHFQSIEVGEIKHPKQDKRTFDLLSFGSNQTSNRSYIYGKQNNLFFVKYNIGRKIYYTDKAERKGAVLGISYSGGPTLGLVKPYLLDVVTREINANGSISRGITPLQYDGTNGDVFLDPNEIVGPSGVSRGWDRLKVQPGLHGKIAMHLDWGAFDKFIKGLDLGIMVDFFFKEVPIMVTENNSKLFVNLYVSAHLGKRK